MLRLAILETMRVDVARTRRSLNTASAHRSNAPDVLRLAILEAMRLSVARTRLSLAAASDHRSNAPATCSQGLTLVHFSAQPEPLPTQNIPYIPPHTP
jgi:hypothetical protein